MNNLVLIIDDEESLRTMLKRMLEKDGYSVRVAKNGKEGLEVANECKPQLIITDILMPEMDGLATIMQIKNDLPDLKIIAMSGGGALPGDYLMIAEGLGVYSTISKPIRRKDFLDEVRKALAG